MIFIVCYALSFNSTGKVFFGDSGDAGILASRFLIKILKSSKKQNKALFIKIGGGGTNVYLKI